MKRSVGSSDPVGLALLLLGLLVICAGCATHPSPAAAPGSPREPNVGGHPPASAPGSSSESGPSLPGADRVYPSQEPKNQARRDAAEAFAPPPPPPPAAGAAAASKDRTRHARGERGAPSGSAFSVQVGACRTMAEAEALAARAGERFEEARVVVSGRWFKVAIGSCESRDQARRLAGKARKAGFRGAFVVNAESGNAEGGKR